MVGDQAATRCRMTASQAQPDALPLPEALLLPEFTLVPSKEIRNNDIYFPFRDINSN